MANGRTKQVQSYLGQDQVHEQWQSDYLNPDLDRLYDRAFARLVQALDATAGAKILDAGCGYCYHALRLARHGLQVTGVDFSETALKQGRANVERAGYTDSVQVQQGDLLRLSFADASFDHVVSWGVLMHVPEVEKALCELSRVLKPGGKLALMENDMDSLHVRLWEPALRSTKRLLGRSVAERNRTPRGIEEWLPAESGGLLVRKVDMDWLTRFCAGVGLRLVVRFPTQFTELYANLPGQALKKAVYLFNRLWFEKIGSHRGAMGNVLIFQKVAPDAGTSAADPKDQSAAA